MNAAFRVSVNLNFYWGNEGLRYGFNGMEKDPEDGLNTTDYRQYDSRLGRWLSIDPIVKPWESPYAGFANSPIYFVDPSGLDPSGPPDRTGTEEETVPDEEGVNWTWYNDTWNRTMNTVVVTLESTNRVEDMINGATKSSLPFNNGDYEVRPDDFPMFYFLNPNQQAGVYEEFRGGTGPVNSVFGPNHPVTQYLQEDSEGVKAMRYLAYDKFNGDIEAMKRFAQSNNGVIYSNFAPYGGTFAPWDEGANPGQFIGTFVGDVMLSADGKSLVFVVTDTKDIYSMFYHTIPKNMCPQGCVNGRRIPNGTTQQKFIWTEPLDNTWWFFENYLNKRDKKDGQIK